MAKILVVDDDKDILLIVNLLLNTHNHIVKTISNPENALEQIRTFNPDLILLDVNIGRYDGREICKQVKSDIDIKHIPIVLFSALMELQDTCTECEASDFIGKPFTPLELIEKIQKHLKIV